MQNGIIKNFLGIFIVTHTWEKDWKKKTERIQFNVEQIISGWWDYSWNVLTFKFLSFYILIKSFKIRKNVRG